MPRIIIIGECTLDIVFPSSQTVEWPLKLSGRPAGRLFNAAAMLAAKKRDITFVGEAARDAIGSLLVDTLSELGADTHCIDHFSDGGINASNFVFPGQTPATVNIIPNRRFPDGEKFDATWPRIDAGDIVVFGGWLAIDERSRQQVTEILQYAADRRALIVYLPGFAPSLVSRITKVMPSILENLEMANMVVTNSSDLKLIFNDTDGTNCYNRNISFYCRTLLDIGTASGCVTLFQPGSTTTAAITDNAMHLSAQAAALAMLIDFLAGGEYTAASLDEMTDDARRDLVEAVASAANSSVV